MPMSYAERVALENAVHAALEAGESPEDVIDAVETDIEQWQEDNG